MAFVHFRRARKLVHIYYHDRSTGKLVQLPRTQTKHLDGKPTDEVYAWVEKWEKEHGMSKDRAARENLSEDDQLLVLWKQYQSNRMSTRKRRPRTAHKESQVFEADIVSFFAGIHHVKDPSLWHDLVPKFHTHLFARGLGDGAIQRTLWTLERFGKHLVFQRYMSFPFVIQIPSRQDHKTTPLKIRKSPGDILKFVKDESIECATINFRLAILIGYFGGLRPSEVFALEKSDLITGDNAVKLSGTYSGFKKFDLGSRLSISVTKTIGDYLDAKPEEMTKTETSCGIVNIWDAEAAKLIAAMVKVMPSGRLFPFSFGWVQRAWRLYVKPKLGATPHDLRRASGLYLGRTIRIDLTLLQEHMRHAEIETTLLYTREPRKVEKIQKFKQDFDDVA